MYELFILGELKEKPMHGYLLHHTISLVLGPLRPMSWGSLYPILRRMEEDGWIRQVPHESGTGPGRPRRVYELTALGDQEFRRLMLRPLEHNDGTEDLFRVKLSKFRYMPTHVQLEILTQYKIFLEVRLSGVEDQAGRVRTSPNITDEERPQILNVLDYDASVLEAKLAWVEKYLASLQHRSE